MNKHDLIKGINKEKYDFSKPETSLDSSDYKEGYNDASDDILDIIKKLDEPQKVKVPKVVAEYVEWCHFEEITLWEVSKSIRGMPEEVWKWLDSSINQDIFARAMLDGYEVEEEPKWVVKVDDNAYFVDFFDSLTPHLVDGLGWEVMRLDDKSKADAVALIIGGKAEKA